MKSMIICTLGLCLIVSIASGENDDNWEPNIECKPASDPGRRTLYGGPGKGGPGWYKTKVYDPGGSYAQVELNYTLLDDDASGSSWRNNYSRIVIIHLV